MNAYKEAVFDALMWGQAVEDLVRDCSLKAIANGKLKASHDHIENVKSKFGLSSLADTLKPCIEKGLYERLKSFTLDRNDVAHRAAAAYMSAVLRNASASDVEMWKLDSVKKNAGQIFGDLLHVYTQLLT